VTVRRFIGEFIVLFILTYILSLIISYVYTILVHGIGIIDYSLSLRLGILFGIALPVHRRLSNN
jgi:hypothetical protein